jgi:hypothetical protein
VDESVQVWASCVEGASRAFDVCASLGGGGVSASRVSWSGGTLWLACGG